ncbi:hypothetical protein ACHWQZ_G003938 [Mnemiopsis leidyi]
MDPLEPLDGDTFFTIATQSEWIIWNSNGDNDSNGDNGTDNGDIGANGDNGTNGDNGKNGTNDDNGTNNGDNVTNGDNGNNGYNGNNGTYGDNQEISVPTVVPMVAVAPMATAVVPMATMKLAIIGGRQVTGESTAPTEEEKEEARLLATEETPEELQKFQTPLTEEQEAELMKSCILPPAPDLDRTIVPVSRRSSSPKQGRAAKVGRNRKASGGYQTDVSDTVDTDKESLD